MRESLDFRELYSLQVLRDISVPSLYPRGFRFTEQYKEFLDTFILTP